MFAVHTLAATLSEPQLSCWPAISSSAEIKINDTAARVFQEEPEAKWPLLTLTRVREALVSLTEASDGAAPQPLGAEPHRSSSKGAANARAEQPAEPAGAETAYERLSALDPLRSGYYKDAAAGRAHVVLRPSMSLGAAHA